jgi:hypothetical protein
MSGVQVPSFAPSPHFLIVQRCHAWIVRSGTVRIAMHLTQITVRRDAVDICQTRSSGSPCVVFARDQEILIPFEIQQ